MPAFVFQLFVQLFLLIYQIIVRQLHIKCIVEVDDYPACNSLHLLVFL